jgi:hypothetical protein
MHRQAVGARGSSLGYRIGRPFVGLRRHAYASSLKRDVQTARKSRRIRMRVFTASLGEHEVLAFDPG